MRGIQWFVADWIVGLVSQLQLSFNSLPPGRFERKFRLLIFNMIWVINGWSISMQFPSNRCHCTEDKKSKWVQVMAWYGQATSHCLSQCWPRWMSSYGITRPQWVNLTTSSASSDESFVKTTTFLFLCCRHHITDSWGRDTDVLWKPKEYLCSTAAIGCVVKRPVWSS